MRSELLRGAALLVVVASQQTARAEGPEFQRGVCYAHTWQGGGDQGYGSATSARTLDRLRSLGVGWVSLTSFGFMATPESPAIETPQLRQGESDARVSAEIAQSHQRGLSVTLKPHLWIHRGEWQGDLRWPDAVAFRRWFDSYRAFILHQARLAEREHVDLFVVGTELKSATFRDPAAWRALIAEVRSVYRGPLTYAANWDEAEHVAFWDALDFIGVQAYAPLTARPGATDEELRAGWRTVALGLEALAARHHKRILLTELGYRATCDAAMAPATWPERDPHPRYDPAHQAACYRAAFETLWGRPWLAGIYFWKWFTDSKDESGPTDFSPAGKPAEHVMGEFYRRRFAAPPAKDP